MKSIPKLLIVTVSCLGLLDCSATSVRSSDFPNPTSQLKPFSDSDLAREHRIFKAFLAQIDDSTDREKFEKIIGKKLDTIRTNMKTGSNAFVSIYGVSYLYKDYSFGFSFTEGTSDGVSSFGSIVHFSNSDPEETDKCLLLRDVKLLAKAGGWAVDPTFVGWSNHGFRAQKGRLHLEATANFGAGEQPLSEADVTEWLDRNGDQGCIGELRVRESTN